MPYRPTAATRESSVQRERALRESARSIVVAEGFRAATVKAIAAGAGVGVGTLYSYFGTREELLAEVFRECASIELASVSDAVEQADGATAQLRALIETFSRRAIRGRRLAWSLLVEPVDPLIDGERIEYRQAYSTTVAAIVDRGIRQGEFPLQDPRTSGAGIVGAIGEALTGPLSPLGDDTTGADDLIRDILTLCLRAVGAPHQPEGRS